MTDQNTSNTNQNQPSFSVDDYVPPTPPPVPTAGDSQKDEPMTDQANSAPAMPAQQDQAMDQMPASDQDDQNAQPQPAAAPTTAPAGEEGQPVAESLEAQNIFFLLGVVDATDEEKEEFLDQLQEVIWEDFIENDVELLLTEEEIVDFKKIMQKSDLAEEEQQEEMVIFLEKLIPDLEEIMLEKALELKEDMFRERISGLKEYFAGKDEQLKVVDEAEKLMQDNQWRAAAEQLNSLL